MRFNTIFSVAALGLALAVPLSAVTLSQGAQAQERQPDASQDVAKQVPLTDQQIEAFLAAQEDMDAIIAKLPDQEAAQPDPKVIAQLDVVAKKYKFADYAEYETIGGNIGLIVAGIDPETKKYIGAEAVIKKEIAEIQADKKMSAKDKKEQLDDLNAQLQSVVPPKIPANIELVSKYYDKLSASTSQEGDD